MCACVPQASFGLSKRVGAAPPAPTANRIAQLKALMAAQEEAARQRAAAQEQAARQHAAQQAELARELQEELRRQELHHSFDLQLDSMQPAAPTDMQLATHGTTFQSYLKSLFEKLFKHRFEMRHFNWYISKCRFKYVPFQTVISNAHFKYLFKRQFKSQFQIADRAVFQIAISNVVLQIDFSN